MARSETLVEHEKPRSKPRFRTIKEAVHAFRAFSDEDRDLDVFLACCERQRSPVFRAFVEYWLRKPQGERCLSSVEEALRVYFGLNPKDRNVPAFLELCEQTSGRHLRREVEDHLKLLQRFRGVLNEDNRRGDGRCSSSKGSSKRS